MIVRISIRLSISKSFSFCIRLAIRCGICKRTSTSISLFTMMRLWCTRSNRRQWNTRTYRTDVTRVVDRSTHNRGRRADCTRLWGTLGHSNGRCRRCRINTSGYNLAILTDNSLAEDSFGGYLLAGDNLLAMFGHNSVDYVVKFLVTILPRYLHLPRHTRGLWHTVTLGLVDCKGCVASQELRVGIRVSVRFSSGVSPDSRGDKPHGKKDQG